MVIANLIRAFIMGAPGSGKGTISNRIKTDFGLNFISSGDLLRSEMINKSEIGEECVKYIKHGALVPDNIMEQLVLVELTKMKDHSWLLDGFPRNISQAEILHKSGCQPNTVLYLNVPFEVIIDRVKGRWVHMSSGRVYHDEFNPPKVTGKDDITGEPLEQRVDDNPETVMARLQAYSNQTEPVADYYRKKGLLEEFTGRESNQIWPFVRAHLTKFKAPVTETIYK